MTRRVVITGAAGGIGHALVEAFAAAGDEVIAIDRARKDNSPAHSWIAADLAAVGTDDDAAAAMIAQIADACGGRCDVLINNAAQQILGNFATLTTADWQTTLAVNLLAPVALTRGLLPIMPMTGAVVINISSIHARQTKPGFTAYATSKAALSGLTRALAVELGARARFIVIEPAAIATPMLQAGFADNPEGYAQLEAMHPAGRIGLPEEVARLALTVSQPGMDFVNGTAIGIDGAISVRLHDPA